ncbi:epoxyqueuosine reductase [Desulfosediminicola flagellatus]|uniref:epoxyqueuosine reductase n=1 Tax=Desulfosediminicola flagellatus TaxID=2569541 RepID=UPI0010AC8F83|nr:epoxyqueuosine reductase [Desulfosediminicola flagellatus]
MISRLELTEKIIAKAQSLGASLAGVASVASLKASPSHTLYPRLGNNLHENTAEIRDGDIFEVAWPEDAVSVVVIGVEHSAERPELDWWDGKGTSGNRILIDINKHLSAWIEETLGVTTYKLPYAIEKGGLFLKDAAVLAGLGCIGRNNLVITPEYGPRIRFRAMLLDREVEPIVSSGFNPCELCDEPCRKVCPVQAFQSKIYSAESLAQSILPGFDGYYDRVTCNLKMEKDIDDAARDISSDEKKQQEARKMINEFEKSHINAPTRKQPVKYCVKYCRKCELRCPVGQKAGKI